MNESTETKWPCVVATDVRLGKREGHVWADHQAASYDSWRPFANAFGGVTVVGREDTRRNDGSIRVDGEGVTVFDVPTYSRLPGLVRTLPRVWRSIQRVGDAETVFIGRLPEPLSLLLFLRSKRVGARFVAMVVSDPEQLFAAHFGGARGRLIGRLAGRLTGAIVRRSAGVVYVSEWWLQSSYPAAGGVPTLARSNVHLPEGAFIERAEGDSQLLRIVSVGSLTGTVKGPDILIDVVADLRAQGLDARMTFVGGGQDLGALRDDVAKRALDPYVSFVGHVSDPIGLRSILDAADVYVSASRAEGLPRATVEAMARGLAVVTTKAGAAIELVDEHWLVDIDSVDQIVSRVIELRSPEIRMQAGRQNQMRARHIQKTASTARLESFLRSHFVRT